MSVLHPYPLGLFLHAHINGAAEAERCLGMIERLLLRAPADALLLGSKSALMLIVQGDSGLPRNDPVYRRNALALARAALRKAGPATALRVRVINGLAWARLGPHRAERQTALGFLQALERPYAPRDLPQLIEIDGLAALAALYHEEGRWPESAGCYRRASRIDRLLARLRYAALRVARQDAP
ncbi:hypothetical protein [Marivita sp. GX14005]|uniref:hypothetical protein n=1 Tax=Marivita sp. GX14005 TaxID=2942276 RepID=UPI0020190721|nr:hypothetical protein [Marivita sp. GX14005]MCL3883028.1 hypothetical protein [Marivita sp. GX14005]